MRGYFTIIFWLLCAVFTGPLLHAETKSSDDEIKITDLKIIPISASELEAYAPNALLSSETFKKDQAVRDSKDFPKNTKLDYILIGARALINGSAIAYGLIIHNQADFWQALPPAALAGTMSGALQAYLPQFNFWLNQKGFFKPSSAKKAHLVESFFKEFAMTTVYVGLVNLVSAYTGLQSEYFSWATLKSAAIDLPAESIWYIWIAQFTKRMLDLKPEKEKIIWKLSKSFVLVISLLSTYGAIMLSNGHSVGAHILLGLTASGMLTYILTRPKFCRRALELLSKRD